MHTKLKQYFPTIRTREEILKEIDGNMKLTEQFYSWNEETRQEFLDICTGVKGVKLLYDSFFKEIMNPETVPERLEDFLSVLLNRTVKIVEVLPGDSSRLADEQSLLIMDILVRFEDGTYCNIEVQKIGYAFPGERSACYSADLLLRQYKTVRSTKKEKFSYKDIKEVYTIVLLDKSTGDFKQFKEDYRHIFQQKSDTGLEINLLQNYVFVPLDLFRKSVQDKGIKNKLDAWLTFLSIDEPDMIIKLIEEYPEFKAMYQQAYEICRNVEGLMGIFSEELKIMDRNTVRYMVDQMQEELDDKQEQLELERHQRREAEQRAEEERLQRQAAENRQKESEEEIQRLKKEMEALKKL
nr:PD-(D/E)XK nuclease family transposase [uncultured Blautia sp.]